MAIVLTKNKPCLAKTRVYPDSSFAAMYIDNLYYGEPIAGATLGAEQSPITDSCTCPTTGDWQIINGDACTLATECNMAGSLHIVNGSLVIIDTGTLTIPKEQIIAVKQNSNLAIQLNGKSIKR